MSSELQDLLQRSLGDSYRLSRELGGGGIAKVFVAEDQAQHRRVVVKVLSPDLAPGVNLERFRREIQVAARLHHPRIVSVLGAGQSSDALLYYTMPFIDGESLRERIEREKRLAPGKAFAIAADVADALAYAHEQNIVHRDVKPENILIEHATQRAVVTDFGIARAIERAADIRSVTSTGLTVGTPTYMSPEQAAGEGTVDGRSDIYSLGCVLYEMLTGAPPFTGPTARAIIAKHMQETPTKVRVLVPEISAAYEAVVDRMLAKSPVARFPSAAHLAIALLDPNDSIARALMPAPRHRTRRHVVLLILLAAAVAILSAWFLVGRW